MKLEVNCFHRSPLLDPILSQMSLIQNLTPYSYSFQPFEDLKPYFLDTPDFFCIILSLEYYLFCTLWAEEINSFKILYNHLQDLSVVAVENVANPVVVGFEIWTLKF
jgi:hypothetical protein